jgi:hypothetical protein
MIGARQFSPCMMFTILGSVSSVFTEGSSMFGKTHPVVTLFFWRLPWPTHLLLCFLSFRHTLDDGKYLSKVASLAMHSFSIWLTSTLEFIFNMQFWTPIPLNLRRPNSTASYSAILLLHFPISAVNCKNAVYLSLVPEGNIRIAGALAPEAPQAPSKYTCHGVSITGPSL